jgi:hypothetical protein
MAYDATCPSCQARLDIKDDAGDAWLICPRCLNVVPHPAGPSDAIVAGPGSVTATRAAQKPAVPTVASETKRASWQGYFVVLILTVLAIIGMALIVAHSDFLRSGNGGILVLALVAMVVFLAGLIVYPLGRSQFRSARLASARLGESRGRSTARYFGVVMLMLFMFPIALFIIFFTVCTAVLVTAR